MIGRCYKEHLDPILVWNSVNIVNPKEGKGNENLTIKIKGYNFTKGSIVSFDKLVKVISLKYIDNMNVEANVFIQNPNIETKVKLKVTNEENSSSEWFDGFTVKHTKVKEPIPIEKRAACNLETFINRELPRISLGAMYNFKCIKDEIARVLIEDGFSIKRPTYDNFDRLITYERKSKGIVYTDRKRFERSVISVQIIQRDNNYHIFITGAGAQRRRDIDLEQEEEIEDKFMSQYVDRLIGKMNFLKCTTFRNKPNMIFYEKDKGFVDIIFIPDHLMDRFDFISSIMKSWGAKKIWTYSFSSPIKRKNHLLPQLEIIKDDSDFFNFSISSPNQRNIYIGNLLPESLVQNNNFNREKLISSFIKYRHNFNSSNHKIIFKYNKKEHILDFPSKLLR